MTTAPVPSVQQLESGLFRIDLHFQGVAGVIASYLLADSADDLTLVETGPSTTIDALLAGIRAAGFDPDAIRRLAVTHIHLDHAGAAGSLLQRLPGARLSVHQIGLPHLIDPTKLIASATRIYGEAMERLWGEIVPVPADRVDVLQDGQELQAGGRTLRAYYTPGHASHHVAYHDPASGAVFTGDVAGVRLGDTQYVCPPTPPPDIDLALWQESVARLRALRPRRLYLTHFGAFADPEWHFDDLMSRLGRWTEWVEGRLTAEPDTAVVAAELQRLQERELAAITHTDAQTLSEAYELATPSKMNVDGLARYLKKRVSAGARPGAHR
ncbi:MAG: MBL fold metallo-hydrolase [Chloroflexota bacterium]|nr:MBL fold metallo-hydrolase [Chloroflexota bacterium]